MSAFVIRIETTPLLNSWGEVRLMDKCSVQGVPKVRSSTL